MRFCTTCGCWKPEEEFAWRFKDRGVRQNKCKTCQYAYQKDWYQDNKESHKIAAGINRDRTKEENFRKLIEYLSDNPCVDCGEKDPVVLEFDHRGEKERNIASMMASVCSWAKILTEIEKCDVRCCNCHRRKTAKQFGWRKAIPLES